MNQRAFSNETEEAETIAEEVCRKIADDVIRGDFPPGTKLEGQVLADRYGISRTPVREALRQLVTTGLVEVRPRKGFTVSEINGDQLAKMFEALGEVESLCTRFAAQRMSATERKKLQRLHEHCAERADGEDIEAYFEADNEFHDAIQNGAHNEYMTGAAAALRMRLAPFRFAHFRVEHRSQTSSDEHDRIVRAIVAGSPDEAQAAMREHFTNSAIEAIEYVTAKQRR